MSAHSACVQQWTGSPSQYRLKKKKKETKKNIKIINTGKKEVQLLTYDMTVYVKNPKKSTKKLLELGRIINLAVNLEKSFVFLYTCNNWKMKSEKLSFTIKAKH